MKRIIIAVLLFIQPVLARWHFTNEIDQMTDSKIQVLSLIAYKGKNRKGERPSLIIRQTVNTSGNKNLDIYFNFGEVVDDYELMLRFDKEKPIVLNESDLIISDDYTSIFIFGDKNKINMLNGFRKKNILKVRYFPFHGIQRTISFNLKGFTSLIKRKKIQFFPETSAALINKKKRDCAKKGGEFIRYNSHSEDYGDGECFIEDKSHSTRALCEASGMTWSWNKKINRWVCK